MRLILTFLWIALLGSVAQAQGIFNPISESQLPATVKSAERVIIPAKYATFEVDYEQLVSTLKGDLSNAQQSLQFPISQDEQLTFYMKENSAMPAKLQAKFPEIRTFRGLSKDGTHTLYLNFSPYGVNAVMRSNSGLQYLMPYVNGINSHVMLCDRVDLIPVGGLVGKCGNEEYLIEGDKEPLNELDFSSFMQEKAGDPVAVRSYRVAVATTSEFTTQSGGISQAMDIINTSLMIMNEIYNRELAVNLELIADNEQLVYNNANTDPYSTVNDAGGLLIQNQANLTDVLGSGGFDIGHVFTVGCINNILGIAARASVCNSMTKGRGVTCHPTNLSLFQTISGTMAHEIGHSFDAGHTWNKCSEATADQYASDSAFEPGSGSTIMSYQGSCNGIGATDVDNNISGPSVSYFHVGSLVQMYDFIENGNGGTCVTESGSNATPDIVIESPVDVVIPISTAFRLNATATDPENHNLTYCWEQYDLGPVTNLGEPLGNAPAFRSFPPIANGERIFPRLPVVLASAFSKEEVLPTYSRDFKFRMTVRDDNIPNAGVTWTEIGFSATDQAGPFIVSSPTNGSNWEVGSSQTITWDVANTNVAPVNCQTVNIWMSTDGGQNFDIPLAMDACNSGSIDIVVPNEQTTTGRILIEAVGNIFLDINAGNFSIVPAADPGILLAFEENFNCKSICYPGELDLNLTSDALNGYSNAVSYSVTGLPTGGSATFSPNPGNPGDAIAMTIAFDGTVSPGDYDLTIVAEGDGLTTINRTFSLSATDQNFSGLTLDSPANGATGVAQNAVLTWDALSNADNYDIRVSTNPAFDEDLIEGNGLAATSFSPSQPFEKSTLYYWQVRAINDCGPGDWTAIRVFQTEIFACNTITQDDDLTIPVAEGVYSSKLDVAISGTISDLNVANIDIDYAPTSSFIINLIGPSGQKELLFNKKCGGANKLDIGFDSDATSEITCPPSNGGIFLPDGGDLGNFSTLGTEGEWTLEIETTVAPFNPGTLNEWSLEFCANATPSGPFVVRNEPILCKTDDAQWVSSSKLKVEDADNSSSQLVYTLVQVPTHGTLENESGATLVVGDNFTQSDINNYTIKYVDGPNDEAADDFVVTVIDGTGGFLAPTTVLVSIDDSFEGFNNVDVIPASEFSLFPNPTSDLVHLQSDRNQIQRNVKLIDSRGQVLNNYVWRAGSSFEISTKIFPAGIYFLQIQEGEAIGVKRFTIFR